MSRINDNVQAFFESIGEDPNNVSAAGITNEGYFVFVRDDQGRKLQLNGESIRERRDWPSYPASIDWNRFLDAVRADSQ